MSKFGYGILGAFPGAVGGGLLGLGGGLAWITLAATSSFEGHSGFVAGYWIPGGFALGMNVGAWLGARRG
jgi:hypothetical protein